MNNPEERLWDPNIRVQLVKHGNVSSNFSLPGLVWPYRAEIDAKDTVEFIAWVSVGSLLLHPTISFLGGQ